MDTPLHDFAARHDGVLTRAVAESLGYPWPVLRRLVADEGWQRTGRATFAMPLAAVTLRTRVRAAQLRRPALVASHRTAARLYGADVLTDALEFLDDGGRYDVPGGRARRTTWRRGDVVTLDGLTVTSPARTASDLLRCADRDEAVCAVDGLLRCGAVALDAIAAYLGTGPARYRARAWRAFRSLDPRAGSVAESSARLRFEAAGLPPRTQVVLAARNGRAVRVDLWFAPHVAVEIEGFALHGTREAHQQDVTRFNALSRVPGVTVLRFSRDDVVHRPAAMIATVRAALALPVSTDNGARSGGEHGRPYSPVTSGSSGRRAVG